MTRTHDAVSRFDGVWVGTVDWKVSYDLDDSVASGRFRDFWTVEQRGNAVVYSIFWNFLGTTGDDEVLFGADVPLKLPALVRDQYQRVLYVGWADENEVHLILDVNNINLDGGVEIELPGFTLELDAAVEGPWDYSESLHEF